MGTGTMKEVEVEESVSPATTPSAGNLGCHINRRLAVFLGVLFVSATVAVGVLAYYSSSRTLEHGHKTSGYYVPLEPVGDLPAAIVARDKDEIDIRLPKTLKPLHYVVKLQPFINGNFSIEGYVEVEIEVIEPTSNITLHIADIITKNETIKVVPSDDVEGPGVEVKQNLYDKDRNFYIGVLGEELELGKRYILSMEFVGLLNDQLIGFYRSTYTDEDGNTRWVASTQFEATDARRAFPCFDEPAMKATFEIFLARETSMSSISNMPKFETFPVEGQDGWVWDHFNTTVPMSTYLLAFVISDYTHIDSDANDHVLFRVWTREGAIQQADLALKTGPVVLSFYEEYFSVPFPLPKQDMIAIPAFTGGSMENWGLIIYSESSLLYDPAVSSAADKQHVTVIISHELAHQWFGDLVTPDWWTDLWLNEGFASFVENIGTDHVEPTWKMWEQFVSNDLQDVLEMDSLESSHPISIPVGSPDEIDQIFDSISYSKGASVIRMMNHFLTETTFRKGVTNYLNGKAFSNAEQDDLWQYLTDAAHEDDTLPPDMTVKEVMDTWTLQMGYPVIKVVRSSDGTSATLTQERFLLVKNENSSDTHDYKWWVPLTYTSQDNPNFNNTQAQVWMKDSEAEITVSSLPEKDQWVIFNIQETGYYRVDYDDDNWNLLIQQLSTDHQVIHVINRAQIIDDAMDLARAGLLSYNIAMSVNEYLKTEAEFIAWNTALHNLEYLEMMFTRKGAYGALKRYLLDLLIPLYNSVGFEDNPNDPHLETYKRVLALSNACHLDYEDCVQNSVSLFQQWMQNPSNSSIVSPNLKRTVYCTAIAAGGEEEWNFGWNQYLASNVGSEKSTLLYALGCTKEIWILSRYLDMTFYEGSSIQKRDAPTVFYSISDNDVGRDVAWNYLRDQWDQIYDYIGIVSKVGDMILAVSYEFNTNEEKHELEVFKADHAGELGAAEQTVDQAIERTGNNIAWLDHNYEVIVQWLQDHGYEAHKPSSIIMNDN
ncbi:aminopeptidase N [Cherax quadricarinatus]